MAGQETIDPRFGYFLSTTWHASGARRPRLQTLSYAGSLTAEPSVTTQRDVWPGSPSVRRTRRT